MFPQVHATQTFVQQDECRLVRVAFDPVVFQPARLPGTLDFNEAAMVQCGRSSAIRQPDVIRFLEFETLNFPRCGFRQVVHEYDLSRVLPFSYFLFDPIF